jgi:hypothetical protein
VNPRDADVLDALHRGAEGTGDQRRLGRDGGVGGPRAHHAHGPGRDGELAEHHDPRHVLDQRRGQGLAHRGPRRGIDPGRHRGASTGALGKGPEQGHDLPRRLPGGIDDLGVTGPQRPVGVEPGKPQVEGAGTGEAVQRAGGEDLQGPVGRHGARGDVL